MDQLPVNWQVQLRAEVTAIVGVALEVEACSGLFRLGFSGPSVAETLRLARRAVHSFVRSLIRCCVAA